MWRAAGEGLTFGDPQICLERLFLEGCEAGPGRLVEAMVLVAIRSH